MSAEMRPLPSLRPPLHLPAEDGFTLIEVLVAVLLLTVGLLGLIGAFDSARKLDLLSERRTSMAHRAQLEIERLQAIPYGELAMASAPTHSTETTNPDFYVTGGGTEYQYGAASTEAEKLVSAGATGSTGATGATGSTGVTGAIEPSPSGRNCSQTVGACEWADGPVSGNVYDFVTWHADPTCLKTVENYKRLTVAVTVKVPSGNHQPAAVRVSTLIANPTESREQLTKSC
jgi:prepilin-type N-terminal cleavage/methylation domain-containing protein